MTSAERCITLNHCQERLTMMLIFFFLQELPVRWNRRPRSKLGRNHPTAKSNEARMIFLRLIMTMTMMGGKGQKGSFGRFPVA